MNNKCKLSNVAKTYLEDFYIILDKMEKGMIDVKLTDSISNNFIMQMIPHHRAAIEMSSNILKYTTNIELQNIASNIISEQTKSIENMLTAQPHCSTITNSQQDISLYNRAFRQITQTMFSDMSNADATNNVNADFVREMIPHHKGAVRMSENALKYEICEELKPILDAIIISQCKGIKQMERILKWL